MTVSRRQAVVVLAAAGVFGPLSLWLTSRDCGHGCRTTRRFRVRKSDAEWRAALPRERYRILRGRGTERAFSSPLNAEKRSGMFRLRSLRTAAVFVGHEVREWNGLAELLAAARTMRWAPRSTGAG